jgi:acetyl-CoA synthetase
MLEKYCPRTLFTSYEDFMNMGINCPDPFNFAYDVVDEFARTEPDKRAMVWCNDEGQERTFTFAEMKVFSDRAANVFRAHGIGKGDPVMLILKRHYEYWFCILALHKLGAIGIPATHLLTKKDISYRCQAADIKMIVAVNEDVLCHEVEASQSQSPSLKVKAVVNGRREGWIDFSAEMEQASEKFERPSGGLAVRNSDIMLLYFTSGTTGMPKMVQHNFTYPLGHILTAKFWQNVEDNGLHLTVADTGWAKAAWGKIYGQWLCGCAVFVYDYNKFVPKELLAVISKYGITSFCAPPTIFRFFIKEDLGQYHFDKLKYCTVAGEPLNPEVYQQWLKATGLRLVEGYGQTELTVTVANFPWMGIKPGSMGKPSPGYDIDLVDENGHSCGVGEEGQIVLRTDKRRPPGMFDGYYRDPALTQKVWHDDVYYTGDNAWRDEDGYYWFVGRADDVIKSSGHLIGPFEVESALMEHPAVAEAGVIGIPEPTAGEVVKAYVALKGGFEPSEALRKELLGHARQRLGPAVAPKDIAFRQNLPKTRSGKIMRRLLKARELGLPEGDISTLESEER